MTTSSQERPQDSGGAGAIGLLAALPGELGDLEQFEQGRDSLLGVEVRRLEIEGRPVIAAVGGVGKVSAAGAASAAPTGAHESRRNRIRRSDRRAAAAAHNLVWRSPGG